ncbi:uncharacterized protein LOC112183342 isoform X7 [Rosa chinensis]|uniref:uncharacterized protein LOC112183342 isoform X7 n=1 Tax=Rosa chinensis TaxID=74649 RepID=UPI001AD93F9B|nr:uncharacterized protein LOC112183342 isoform X7 [Rosa chinensis]
MASEPVNVNEFQELAKQVLPKMYYDFYTGGAEDQFTLKENVEAFRRITLRPRVLVDVSRIDMSTTVLGYKISAPIMIAPTSRHQLAHPEGEVATARAAAASNTIMILSYSSTCTVEEVASSCNAVRFFQLYVFKRRDISDQIVQRAEKNGYKAIVLTVDAPRLGRREADIKNKMISTQLKNFEGLISTELDSDEGSNLEAYVRAVYDDSLCWEDVIGWLKSITNLPILVKGILTHEDDNAVKEPQQHGGLIKHHIVVLLSRREPRESLLSLVSVALSKDSKRGEVGDMLFKHEHQNQIGSSKYQKLKKIAGSLLVFFLSVMCSLSFYTSSRSKKNKKKIAATFSIFTTLLSKNKKRRKQLY